jgi:hypothetical protein
MEPFTLIIWLWMGQRFEQTEITDLSRKDCLGHYARMIADRGQASCVGANGVVRPISPVDERPLQCAACGRLPELPPGHKRI